MSRRPRPTAPPARPFLNVDLDLLSGADLAPLARAWEGHVYVLRCGPESPGKHVLSVELNEPWPPRDRPPEPLVAGLCALVEALPPALRALWDGCTHRDFSIGLESWVSAGRSAPMFEVRLSAEVLARVARLGATVSATLYPLYDVQPAVQARYARGRGRRGGRHARVVRQG